MHTGCWCRNRKEKENLANLRAHGRCGLDSHGSSCGQVAGSSEREISLLVLINADNLLSVSWARSNLAHGVMYRLMCMRNGLDLNGSE